MMNFESIEALDKHVGKELGVSPWFSLSQQQVNAFADTTLDFQGITWIQTQPEPQALTPPLPTAIYCWRCYRTLLNRCIR